MWIRAFIHHIFVMILLFPAYNPPSPNNGFPLHSEYKTNAFIRYKKFQMIWIHRYDWELILHCFDSGIHQSFKILTITSTSGDGAFASTWNVLLSDLCQDGSFLTFRPLLSVNFSEISTLPICPRSTTRHFYPLSMLYFSSLYILLPSHYAACLTVCLLSFIRM